MDVSRATLAGAPMWAGARRLERDRHPPGPSGRRQAVVHGPGRRRNLGLVETRTSPTDAHLTRYEVRRSIPISDSLARAAQESHRRRGSQYGTP